MRIATYVFLGAALLALTSVDRRRAGQADSCELRRRAHARCSAISASTSRPAGAPRSASPSRIRASASDSSSSTPTAGSTSTRTSPFRSDALFGQPPDPPAGLQRGRESDAGRQPGPPLRRCRPRRLLPRSVEITEYIGTGVICDPYWYVCGTYPVEAVVGSRGGWDFGFNFGGGVGFGLGESAEFYVETRYHYVGGPEIPADAVAGAGGSTNGNYLPITFGFRF